MSLYDASGANQSTDLTQRRAARIVPNTNSTFFLDGEPLACRIVTRILRKGKATYGLERFVLSTARQMFQDSSTSFDEFAFVRRMAHDICRIHSNALSANADREVDAIDPRDRETSNFDRTIKF